MLIEAGANVGKPAKDGRTPAELLKVEMGDKDRREILKLLGEYVQVAYVYACFVLFFADPKISSERSHYIVYAAAAAAGRVGADLSKACYGVRSTCSFLSQDIKTARLE